MHFGLKNSPATFQRPINSVLREYINKICVVYLHDILIFSASLKEHIDSVNVILNKLRIHNSKIQIDKCNFFSKETEYLGHILSPEGIKPNLKKIETIHPLKLPGTQKQIKQFLGITDYYRKCIKDYAKVADGLKQYLKKNAKVNKNDPIYIDKFLKLKRFRTNPPILSYPHFYNKFKLVTSQ